MPNIIDGKAISAAIRAELAVKTEEFKKNNGIAPCLAVIIVGEDPASKVYVANKEKGYLLQTGDSPHLINFMTNFPIQTDKYGTGKTNAASVAQLFQFRIPCRSI